MNKTESPKCNVHAQFYKYGTKYFFCTIRTRFFRTKFNKTRKGEQPQAKLVATQTQNQSIPIIILLRGKI